MAKLGNPLEAFTPLPYLATIAAGAILTLGITWSAARGRGQGRVRSSTTG